MPLEVAGHELFPLAWLQQPPLQGRGTEATPACSLGAQQHCPGSPSSSLPPRLASGPCTSRGPLPAKPQPQPNPRTLALGGVGRVAPASLQPPQTTTQGCEHLQSLLGIRVMVGGSASALRRCTQGSREKGKS